MVSRNVLLGDGEVTLESSVLQCLLFHAEMIKKHENLLKQYELHHKMPINL